MQSQELNELPYMLGKRQTNNSKLSSELTLWPWKEMNVEEDFEMAKKVLDGNYGAME